MYLKALNIRGFKSFADKVSLRFSPGLSAVVGPNGSGKSNISDAVLWVLGERNAKKLRGSLMNDVIFAGSKTRQASSFAEVELVLDNSDHTLALDFSEVSIMRRLTKNGESSYFINGVMYRRCDIISLLHDTALGSGLNSVISQGNLDTILQSSPLERRVLIEEAAGILKIKQQNEKSNQKLARMDDYLAQVRTLQEEMQRSLAPLAKKAARAKKAQDLRTSYEALRFDLWTDELLGIHKRIDAHKATLAKLAEDARELQTLQEEHQSFLHDEQEKRLQFSKQEECLQTRERRAHHVHEKIQSLNSVIAQQLRTYSAMHDSQLRMKEAYPHRFAELKCRFDTLTEQIVSYQHTYDEQQEKQNQIRAELQELRSKRAERTTTLASKREQYKDAQKERSAHQQKLFQNKQRRSVLEEKISSLTARIAELNDECQALKTEQANLQQSSAQFALRNEELQRGAHEARASQETAQQAWSAAQAQVLDVQARYQAAQQKHASLLELKHHMLAPNSAHTWFAEHLRREGTNVSLLIDALHVPAHLENLVSVLLGDYVSAFMFDSYDDAQRSFQVLEHMKESGCVSFLYGAADKTSRLESAHRAGCEVTMHDAFACSADAHVPSRYYDKLLVHQLDIPATLSPHLVNLLGSVVLMPSFEQACSAAQTCNEALCFATPACELAYSDGRVLVARTQLNSAQTPSLAEHAGNEQFHKHTQEDIEQEQQDYSVNLLSISRELRSLTSSIDALKEQLNSAHTYHDTCKAQLERCEHAAHDALQAALEHSATLQTQQLQLKRIADALEKNTEKCTHMKSLLEPLEQELHDTSAASKQLSERLAHCEDTLQTYEHDIAILEDEEDHQRSKRAALQNNLNALQLQAASMHERRQSALLQKAQTEAELNKLEREQATYCEQEQRFQQRKEHTRALQTFLSALDEKYHSIMGVLTQEKDQIARSKSHFEQQFNETLQKRLSVQEKWSELQELQTEQRVDIGKLEVSRDSLLERLEQNGYRQPYYPSSHFERDRARKQFEQLEVQLRQLGNVDVHSITEYEAQKARLTELQAQVADITRAREHIQHIIDVLAKRIQVQFKQAFDETARNFSDVISYLFRGADARLQLITSGDDAENAGGIEIYVSPSGKKISSLRLMSGGERSLCALAFIFAVYRVRNAPFFLLDEVEAALDDANLLRLIRYIDTLQHDSQVIMITHQRATMEHAQILYGVSMRGDGVTRVLSQSIDEAHKPALG